MQVWIWSLNDGRRVLPSQLGLTLLGWKPDKVGRFVRHEDVQFLLETLQHSEDAASHAARIQASWQDDVRSPRRKRCEDGIPMSLPAHGEAATECDDFM